MTKELSRYLEYFGFPKLAFSEGPRGGENSRVATE